MSVPEDFDVEVSNSEPSSRQTSRYHRPSTRKHRRSTRQADSWIGRIFLSLNLDGTKQRTSRKVRAKKNVCNWRGPRSSQEWGMVSPHSISQISLSTFINVILVEVL